MKKNKKYWSETWKNQLDIDGKLYYVSYIWLALRKYETSVCWNDLKKWAYDTLSMNFFDLPKGASIVSVIKWTRMGASGDLESFAVVCVNLVCFITSKFMILINF